LNDKFRATALRTLIVVVLFGALLAYVLLVEAKKAPPTIGTPTPTPPTILSVGDLREVRATDGTRSLRLVRSEDKWYLVDPATGERTEADPYDVTMVTDELVRLEAQERISDQVPDPATYGLDTAWLVVTLVNASGDEVQVNVGRSTPDGGSRYVQVQGDPALYVVAQYKVEPLYNWLSEPPYLPTPTPAPAS
jgi:hypothetical protein